MKLTKTVITVAISIVISVAILAMQKPVTKAIIGQSNSNFKISNTWELPIELNEISGIAWLHDSTFACVQDEDGIIFIYDLEQNNIIDKIEFAGKGDYEGIAVEGENAFVMRSDGLVYEIQNFRTAHKKVVEFKTDFSEQNNIETLTYDSKNKRLLTAPKDKDLKDDNFKGIYQISLDQKTMNSTPITKINMHDKAFESFKSKKIHKTFNPSDIAVHPINNALYILEGKDPKFIVLSSAGDVEKIQLLDKKTFPQPEGITFNADGRLFISNEAKDGTATILEITIE